MALNPEEIEKLPTITELIDKLKEEEKNISNRSSSSFLSLPFNLPPLINPDIALRNDGRDDQFIVSKLNNGEYSLKPNLTNRKFLYRGEKKDYEKCTPSLLRENKESYIIENIKKDEFSTLVKSHPLSKMLERGIRLNGSNFIFEMNYYGLAQHYGFNTVLLDFTSEIDVAAFFATTYCDEGGKYHPLNKDDGYGVIYYHEIKSSSFKTGPFTTIGLQIFPRSGSQKGFLYLSPADHDISSNPSVKKKYFRHSAEESKKCFDKMAQGNRLFPKDELEEPSKRILNDTTISNEVLQKNLQQNGDSNINKAIKFIEDSGYNIVLNKQIIFTYEDLASYYHDIKNGYWEDFCNQIYFGNNYYESILKEKLLKLPKEEDYIRYFESEYYDKL